MPLILSLVRGFGRLPDGVKNALLDFVWSMVRGDDARAKAERVLEEHARMAAFDAAMKRVKP